VNPQSPFSNHGSATINTGYRYTDATQVKGDGQDVSEVRKGNEG